MESTSVQTPPAVVAEYAKPGIVKHTDGDPTLPQAAALFATLPLVLEIAALVLLIEMRSQFFAYALVIAFAFGVFFVAVCVLFLLGHALLMSGPRRFARFLRTSRLAIFMLVLNFPVSALIIWLVMKYG